MSRIFARKEFSDYLGEDRALNDIVVRYVSDLTPTPTPTPSSTPSATPSITPTPTPSSTPSFTTSGLILHLDASSSSNFSLVTSGGTDYVDTWVDLSPKNNPVFQYSGSARPVYESDGFGSYQVTFDGVNDYLDSDTITNIASGITAFTKFIVFEVNDYVGEFRTDYAFPDNTDSDGFYNGANRWFPIYYPGAYWDNFSGLTKAPNYITWSTKGSSSPSMTGQTNDVNNSGNLFDSWGPDPAITKWRIGAGDTFGIPSSNLDGSIRELLIYDRVLSAGEISTVYSYLKTKWNYTSW